MPSRLLCCACGRLGGDVAHQRTPHCPLSLPCPPTGSSLHLGILMENMRREGYEFEVGPPKVITKSDEAGTRVEPMEEAVVEVPEEHVGQVRRAGCRPRCLRMQQPPPPCPHACAARERRGPACSPEHRACQAMRRPWARFCTPLLLTGHSSCCACGCSRSPAMLSAMPAWPCPAGGGPDGPAQGSDGGHDCRWAVACWACHAGGTAAHRTDCAHWGCARSLL